MPLHPPLLPLTKRLTLTLLRPLSTTTPLPSIPKPPTSTPRPKTLPHTRPRALQLPPLTPTPEASLTEAFLKGSGPGGQKINKTSSAVQLKHLPTGIVIKCQATRSRSQNRKIARKLLAERLEVLEKGKEARVSVKGERERKRKSSRTKKSRRKYRALATEEEGEDGEEERDEEGDEEGNEVRDGEEWLDEGEEDGMKVDGPEDRARDKRLEKHVLTEDIKKEVDEGSNNVEGRRKGKKVRKGGKWIKITKLNREEREAQLDTVEKELPKEGDDGWWEGKVHMDKELEKWLEEEWMIKNLNEQSMMAHPDKIQKDRRD